MENILIAYNNDPNSELHLFFESCADDAKQFCVDNQRLLWICLSAWTLVCNVTPNIHTFFYIFLCSSWRLIWHLQWKWRWYCVHENYNYDFVGKTLYSILFVWGKSYAWVKEKWIRYIRGIWWPTSSSRDGTNVSWVRYGRTESNTWGSW